MRFLEQDGDEVSVFSGGKGAVKGDKPEIPRDWPVPPAAGTSHWGILSPRLPDQERVAERGRPLTLCCGQDGLEATGLLVFGGPQKPSQFFCYPRQGAGIPVMTQTEFPASSVEWQAPFYLIY